MKANVICEKPAFSVSSRSYNESHTRDISWNELRVSELGETFSADSDNCGRARDDEDLTVVYKDSTGVLCRFGHSGTTDSPDPEDWCDEPELIWFEFLHH